VSRGSTNEALELIAVNTLLYLGTLAPLAAILYGLVGLIWGIERLIRSVLNHSLARHVYKTDGSAGLRDLAEFVRAQHGKRHLPKLPRFPPAPP
jgi:hypothetical protein